MQPLIIDEHCQALVPILSQEEAKRLGCKHWKSQKAKESELYCITPDEIKVGDAVNGWTWKVFGLCVHSEKPNSKGQQ